MAFFPTATAFPTAFPASTLTATDFGFGAPFGGAPFGGATFGAAPFVGAPFIGATPVVSAPAVPVAAATPAVAAETPVVAAETPAVAAEAPVVAAATPAPFSFSAPLVAPYAGTVGAPFDFGLYGAPTFAPAPTFYQAPIAAPTFAPTVSGAIAAPVAPARKVWQNGLRRSLVTGHPTRF